MPVTKMTQPSTAAAAETAPQRLAACTRAIFEAQRHAHVYVQQHAALMPSRLPGSEARSFTFTPPVVRDADAVEVIP